MAPQWDLFAGVAVLATVALLALARATHEMLTGVADDAEETATDWTDGPASPAVETLRAPVDATTLVANVALSHGLLASLLVAVAWFAEIPPAALGLGGDVRWIAGGVVLGGLLYAANEVGAKAAERFGVESSERLRALLAPSTVGGWAALLLVALPLVAVAEELLFRGALIGVVAAGYGVSPWWLAVVSSAAFGLGHGVQGPGGVVVTGLLGFALAVAFLATGSLLAVIVAHYVVNALEFVVHEGLLGEES